MSGPCLHYVVCNVMQLFFFTSKNNSKVRKSEKQKHVRLKLIAYILLLYGTIDWAKQFSQGVEQLSNNPLLKKTRPQKFNHFYGFSLIQRFTHIQCAARSNVHVTLFYRITIFTNWR